jgi:signal transduction histidine kinase
VVAELRTVEIDWDGAPALLISLRDVTERNRAEEQARELVREQAARAEAEAGERRYRLLAEEKAALAEENARLYRRAQEASRAKSEFLAVVSHELRTPLNAIIGYTDLLESGIAGPLNEKQRAQLVRVEVNSRHLLEVVDDILTFSGLEAGWEDVRAQPVDYAELVRDVGARIQPLAERKGLSLRVEPPEAPCRGETDAQKVRQVLLNLLTNATKFTDDGGIVFDAAVEGDEIVFRVSDTGIGISAAHLPQIWEPFQQVEPSHTRTVGGTGLGLSLARRLTRLMGGRSGWRARMARGARSRSACRCASPLGVRRHREPVAGAHRPLPQRRPPLRHRPRVPLHLRPDLRVAPADPRLRRHPPRDGHGDADAAVRGLQGDVHPAHQEVLQRERHFVADGVRHLRPQVRQPIHHPPAVLGAPADRGEDRFRVLAVGPRQVLARPIGEPQRPGLLHDARQERLPRPVGGAGKGDEARRRDAAVHAVLPAQHLRQPVHHVLGHRPVGGQLAAGNVPQP